MNNRRNGTLSLILTPVIIIDQFVGRHHFSCSKSLRCHYSVLLTQTKSLILLLCLISFSRTLNAFQLQDLTKSVAPSVNLNILDYPNSFWKKSISMILVNLSLLDFLTTSKIQYVRVSAYYILCFFGIMKTWKIPS